MKNARMATLVRTLKARYPGTRIEVEPSLSPDDPDIRWRVWILNAREKDVPLMDHFAARLARELYGWHTPPFFVGAMGPRATREFLSARRAKTGAAGSRRARSAARRASA